MRIQFLGTAAAEGIPALFCCCDHCERARREGGHNIRTRSGVLIDSDILVDFPPDTHAHALAGPLRLGDVRYLLVTHSHSDHFYPADLDMRRPPFAHVFERPPLMLFGNETVTDLCRRLPHWDALEPYLTAHTLQPFDAADIEDGSVLALPALHKFDEKTLVFRIERGGKRLFYGHDSGVYTEPVWEALRGVRLDMVILDCTFGLGRDGANHMGLVDNIQVRERMLAEGIADLSTQFIVTHFSHNGYPGLEEINEAAKQAGFTAAYDGFTVTI